MEKDIYQMIGAKIVYFRKIKSYSQTELSIRSGMSRTRISLIECGKCHFYMDTLVEIAKALEVDLYDLVEGVSLKS